MLSKFQLFIWLLSLFPLPCFGSEEKPEEALFAKAEQILKQRCYECHSHEGKIKGGLVLDSKSGWEQGGDTGAAVVPNQPEQSLLVKMIRWTDEDHQMPPKTKLPEEERAALEAWIAAGAFDPRVNAKRSEAKDADWWSLRPLVSPPVPAAAGSSNPIDAFVAATLREKELTSAPEADRRALLRRMSFDLLGLPPEEAWVEGYLSDPPALSHEALIDVMLASPRYGERWARHWLDVIHFADSHGFEHDVFRPNAWRFRDYVISALNADTPWPRFIREQLAADAIFPQEPQLTAALGFLGAGTFDASAEGTAPAAFEYVDRDDMVTQTMASFVSTTASCARCHAHKFDPITQEDYFSLQAVFAGVGKGEISYDEDKQVAVARQRWEKVLQTSQSAEPEASLLTSPEIEAEVNAWEAGGGGKTVWQILKPDLYTSTMGSVLTRQADHSLLASGPRPETDSYVVTATSPLPAISGLKITLLTDDSLPMKGPGRADNGNLHVSEISLKVFPADGASPRVASFTRASADFDQASYGSAGLIDGKEKTSWAVHPAVGQQHEAILALSEPMVIKPGERLVFVLPQLQPGHLIGRFSLAVTEAPKATLIALTPNAQAAVVVPKEQRTAAQKVALAARLMTFRAAEKLSEMPQQAKVYAASAAHQAARGAALKAPQPRVIRVLKRGDLDKPGNEVGPGALSVLSHASGRFALDDPNNEAKRRAALAEWIAHPDNPLTWRSIVNRVWHYHFGRGLCDTPSDFGRMGGTPSHLALLDWLAVWFRDEAQGSLKKLHRLILSSRTYRQSSVVADEKAQAADPDNRWLWRMNRQRLDADQFRDAVVTLAGKMDVTMGGPGVQHFTSRPGPQATPVLDYNAYDWSSPGANRRSIYRVVWRGIADPFMEAMDFPDLGLLAPSRGFSASALQALALYNNDFVLHFSEATAQSLPKGNLTDAVTTLFHRALQRRPSPEELAEWSSFSESQGLPSACRLMINSNEFLFID